MCAVRLDANSFTSYQPPLKRSYQGGAYSISLNFSPTWSKRWSLFKKSEGYDAHAHARMLSEDRVQSSPGALDRAHV